MCLCLVSHVQLFGTPWIVACQASLSMGILQARALEWIACPFQGIFPTQGLNPGLPYCRQILLLTEPPGKPCYVIWKLSHLYVFFLNLYIFFKTFFFPTALASTSSTTLRSSGDRGHTCLSLDLSQKVSSFLLWNRSLAIDLLLLLLLLLRKSSLLPSLLRIFIMNSIEFF